MKAKLLKQIRKRFEVKLIPQKYGFLKGHRYLIRDKKENKYYTAYGFDNFIWEISTIMNRFNEFLNYIKKRSDRINQRQIKRQFKEAKEQ